LSATRHEADTQPGPTNATGVPAGPSVCILSGAGAWVPWKTAA